MKINLHIDYEGGVGKDIVANAADMVAFEEKYGISIASLGNDPKVSYLYYLAWHSEKRTGATTDSFEDWLGKIDAVGGVESDPKSKV
jgi:hypothetical protein